MNNSKNSIKEANKEYKKASRNERKVMIAKDVLALLKKKEITASDGYYVHGREAFRENYVDFKTGVTQQQLLDGDWLKQEECECCAKGALFLAKRRIGGGEKAIISLNFNSSNPLGDAFSNQEWDLVEGLFEDNLDLGELPIGILKFLKETQDNPKKRMKKIMKAIVKLNGAFSLSKLSEIWE